MISVDVYDAAGQRLGMGPIFVGSANIRRMLDGVGTISFSHPAHDERAKLFAEERRVRINIEQNGVKRELGRGIIRKRDYSVNASSATISLNGPDTLDELKRRNVLINRAYNNQSIADIVSSLVSLVPDWSADSIVATMMSGRFDGSSVMKALQDLVKLNGLHFRQTPGANILEVGSFGDTAPVTIINATQITEGMYSNDNIALIDTIKHTIASEGVINRIYVLGAGANVDSALTMAMSTRTTPYPIYSVTVNDRTLYYIEDAASIAEYGVIERFVQFKEISPLSNNDTDIIRAANATYDAGVAMLVRYKDPQESYSVSLRKCMQILVPGDKVRLVYKDPVVRDDGTWTLPRDIDDMFWIMSVSESVSTGGTISTSLEISSIDRYEDSIAKTILGQLDQVRVQGAMVQPTISHFTYGPEQVEIDATNSAKVQLIFTDATFSVDRVLMRVRSQPFTSTTKSSAAGGSSSTSSAAGGNHRHKVTGPSGGSLGTNFAAIGGGMNFRSVSVLSSGGGSFPIVIGIYDSDQGKEILDFDESGTHTHTVTIGNHTHPLTYGIYRDAARPVDMTIAVNGVNVTPTPIGTSGADLDTTIDITAAVIGKAGGFRTAHDCIIACASGQGEVLINFDVYESITPFKFGE